MPDLGTVIRALEICANPGGKNVCSNCPMNDKCKGVSNAAMAAAIELLRSQQARIAELEAAQEPRVMTYEVAMKAEVCFLEVKGINQITPFIRYEVNGKPYWASPYIPRIHDPSFQLLIAQEEYNKDARCWTKRPTDEQREATQWN